MSQIFYKNIDYSLIKRGDIFCKDPPNERYRNDNVQIYDGTHLIELEDNDDIDEEGYVPSQFTIEEFQPTHWTDTIEHNHIIWFTPNLYDYSNPTIISNEHIIINNPKNKYPIYFVYNEEYKTPIFHLAIEILQKITIPVTCDHGYMLLNFNINIDNPNSIVIVDNYFVTNKLETFNINSIDKLIEYAFEHNWRDILLRYIYKSYYSTIKPNHYDLNFSHIASISTITNINVKLFDKNLITFFL